MASGKWVEEGVPHRGWEYVDYDDLGAPLEVCQMCEKQEIRHVHTVRHPRYPDLLRVGCDCAEKLTGDYVTPMKRERESANWQARLRRFLERHWRSGQHGSLTTRWRGHQLLVAPRQSEWIAKADGTGGRKTFRTIEDAKRALFGFFDKPPKAP